MPTAPPAEWSPDELESLDNCPVCASTRATLLHEHLKDHVFSAAAGEWRLMSCGDCGCGYLNPRPTPSTIGRAYATYYTHAASTDLPLTGFAWLRRALANGYRNEIYGTRLRPSLGPISGAAARLSRALRNAIEGEAPGLVRVRPKRPSESLILDVGCGSGLSLLRARDAGWRVMGVEPDDQAIRAASARGIEIVAHHLEDVSHSFDGRFERIMLSHVIEHVHDPLAMLRRCRELLAPGGTLWLETPNLASVGHSTFGVDWRGLEPPRHLVLFRREPLVMLLERAGFGAVNHSEPREVWTYLFDQSVNTRRKRLAQTPPSRGQGKLQDAETLQDYIRRARRAVERSPEQSEFLTLTATV